MSYAPIYEPPALAEYKKAIAWYKERSTTAAENMIAEVKKRINDNIFRPFTLS
ncbi:MAG: hypothetical protein WKG06_18410 [Segetibacter sp.]